MVERCQVTIERAFDEVAANATTNKRPTTASGIAAAASMDGMCPRPSSTANVVMKPNFSTIVV